MPTPTCSARPSAIPEACRLPSLPGNWPRPPMCSCFCSGHFPAPVNSGPQHHYVAQAAIAHLDRWARGGPPPPRSPWLETDPGDPMRLLTDDAGIARGGIRTGWVDVPVAALSGLAPDGAPLIATLLGTTRVFDEAESHAPLPGRPGRVRCRVPGRHVAGRGGRLRAGRGRRRDGRRGRRRIPGPGALTTPGRLGLGRRRAAVLRRVAGELGLSTRPSGVGPGRRGAGLRS